MIGTGAVTPANGSSGWARRSPRLTTTAFADYAWYFVGYFLPRLLTLAALTIYTRRIVPDVYGPYSLCLAWVGLATTVLLYWLQNALQRFYPEHEAAGTTGRLFGSAISVALIIIAAASPLLWLAGRSVTPTLATGTVAAFVGQGLGMLVTGTAIASRHRRLFVAYSYVDGALKFALGLVVVFAGMDIGWLLALPAASGGLLFALEVGRLARSGALELRIDKPALRSMAVFGVPLIAMRLGALLLASLDRFMLAWLANPFTLGIYAAAYPLGATLVQVFATPLLTTLATRIFALSSTDGTDAGRMALRQALGPVAAGMGLVVALSIACAEAATRTFLGGAYGSAAAVLPWVSGGLALWTLGSVLAKQFELTKRTVDSLPALAAAT